MAHASIRINAGGFDLHADVWDGGQAESILLLHGLGGNSITWHGVAPLLAERLRAKVLAVDLPGFGASHPRGKAVGLPVLSEIVADLLEQAPKGTAWRLAGNSLGGVVALAAACSVPDRVSRITLAAAALPLTWGRGPRELLALRSYVASALPWLGRRLIARYMAATGVPGIVDEPIRFLFGNPSLLDPELRRRLLEVSSYRLTWVHEAARVLEESTRSLGLTLLGAGGAARWIREVRCPVQNIYGGRDPIYPTSAWQYLERVRPDWTHVRLDAVGHVPQLEVPAAFAERMLAFG